VENAGLQRRRTRFAKARVRINKKSNFVSINAIEEILDGLKKFTNNLTKHI
jgi:hypothetical protein